MKALINLGLLIPASLLAGPFSQLLASVSGEHFALHLATMYWIWAGLREVAAWPVFQSRADAGTVDK